MRRGILIVLIGSLVLNLTLIGVGVSTSSANILFSRQKFSLLSPRVFVRDRNDTIINFTALRGELRSLVTQRSDMRIGLYFEYLPSGVSIGINDKDPFISASLLKTPFIMGMLQQIEKGFLRNEALLTLKETDLDPSYGTLWKEGAGYRLTVEEAIRRSLVESDNTAVRVLDALVPEDMVVEVYGALDIPIEKDGDYVVTTPKNYASIFRCLYLSCFLSFEGSQYMLSTLTNTQFHDGLAEGIPEGVPFAHKIGIFDLQEGGDRILRLDCGIVYVPKRPYMVCLFIEGERSRRREIYAFAADLSARIYRFVSRVSEAGSNY